MSFDGLLQKGATGKTLYCVAYVYKPTPRSAFKGAFLYVHADDDGDARLQFFRSNDLKDMIGKNLRIDGVCPVIGYHLDEETGECTV